MALGGGVAGVLRMRPLSVGDILDETLLIFRRQFLAFVTLTAVVVVPSALLSLGSLVLVSMLTGAMASNRVSGETAMVLAFGSLAITVPVALVTGLGRLMSGVVAVKVSADVILGRPIDIWAAYRQVFGRLGPLLLAGFLVGMVTGAAALCFPVAIFFALSWGLIFPVIVLEGHGGVEAMRRSWNLMRGNRWRLLGCTVLIGIIVTILVALPASLFAVLAAVWLAITPAVLSNSGGMFTVQAGQVIVQALGETVFGAIGYIVMTRFYFDVRVRKEAFDLELRLNRLTDTLASTPSGAPVPPPPL
ncbi:MAG: glycerophosphoryl diester phosphodiesterase membrane domain-containing protein [Chloroflexota bacterium]